jgi:stress response protein YsnF
MLFVVLAVLGSLATIYGTLGRQAEARDLKQANAMAENRTLSLKDEELVQAKTLAKKECITIGPRCQQWQARVDTGRSC